MKRTNFSTVRKCAKGVKVFHQNLLSEHQVDPIAEKVMEDLECRGSPILYGMLMRTIRGFDEILSGKHDDIPESFFLSAGAIEDVIEKYEQSRK